MVCVGSERDSCVKVSRWLVSPVLARAALRVLLALSIRLLSCAYEDTSE